MAVGGQEKGLGVFVSPDRTTAELNVPPGFDRAMLSAPLCEAVLREKGVEITDAVRANVAEFLRRPHEGAGSTFVVARAIPPIHGEDGRIDWLAPAQPEVVASVAHDGVKQSYYDRSAFVLVKAGEPLGKLVRPTPGEDGRDVLGKAVRAKGGKPSPVEMDESILCDAAGNLIAQAEGVLVRTRDTACIRNVLEIAEFVDFSTGNIDFQGDVSIKKGVRDLFTVKAAGNVEVAGLIEAATIIAGGDLLARGGFAGRERGRANCGGNLIAKYLDNVEGEVRGELRVDREVINCDLVVHGGVDSPHGAIIGGKVVATGPVHVGTLGSGAAVATLLHVGSVPRLEPLERHLRSLVERIGARHQELVAVQTQLNNLVGKKRATAADKERQTELIFEIANLTSMLARAQPTLDALVARIGAVRTVDVTVERRIFPATSIVLGGQRFQITGELRGPIRIARDATGALAYFRGEERIGLLVQVAELHASAAA